MKNLQKLLYLFLFLKWVGIFRSLGKPKIIARLQKAAQRISHRLSKYQVVLTKRLFCSFQINWVLSPIEFKIKLNFVTYSLFRVLSKWFFLSFATIWLLSQFEYCHDERLNDLKKIKYLKNRGCMVFSSGADSVKIIMWRQTYNAKMWGGNNCFGWKLFWW